MSFEFVVVIKTMIVLAFAGLASMILKRTSPSTRNALWTIALLCGFLLPFADVLLPQPARLNLPVLPANENEPVIAGSLLSDTAAPTAAAIPSIVRSAQARGNSPSLSQWFAIVWAVGLASVLGRLIVATLSACRLVRRSAAISNPALNSQMQELRNKLPKTKRDRLSRWTAAFLLSSVTTLMFSVAAIHLTPLLSLAFPASFRVMAAPFAKSPQPEPEQQPAVAAITTGSVAGRVLWIDGAASAGATVSAIATSTEGLRQDWVMGVKVAGTAVTDSDGRYRIENLPAGLYHIVTGPVYLPRTFSDVTSALVSTSGTHLVTVAAGKTADTMDFTCVRNGEGIVYEAVRMLTITGKLVFASFGGPRTPSVMINNDDGSVSYWQFRGESRSPGNYSTFYWWPGLDAGKGGVLDTMAKAGEIVTITGTDTGPGYTGRWQGLHILNTLEVTRGGLPQTR
jgi:hypothetical protein